MADLKTQLSWQLNLTSEDLVLILKALGGRLGTSEQVDEARLLGDQITRFRAGGLRQLIATAEQLEKAVLPPFNLR